MKLLAIDLLEEELGELRITSLIGLSQSQSERIKILKEAISQLESLALKSDCVRCRYNTSQEELSELNEEEYINAFNKCRTCSNYYTNNFEENK